ncbi:TonB-dependent receptor domain-containing protein [Hydrogenophaga sp. BPS33]|uniref:TonB-dependent receptor domain-containing protein n=1 Tax=Hydrogenophaga sp. BPS33 TaxID=2651974 RepID=UPI001F26A84B|nr:TonB-dependent receptor [Hydrogenophaga sp. BPS33]
MTSLPPFRPTFLALLCALSATAHAQNPEASTPTLGTVVVTATAREQAVKEAPASISVITREDIDASPATNLRELVGRLEGVVTSAGSPSDNDISIRGMPGEYTLFLVDGKRQSTRETMNRGTGGVQSNLLPPLAAIERIEVVRGPMSSLYGSDAMGGVINIITRKVPQKWGGSVEVGSVVQERSELGNTGNTHFWLGGPVKHDVVGLQIYGGVSKRREDTAYYPNSGFQGAYGSEDRNLTAKATFKIGPDHTVSAEVGTQAYTWEQTPGKTLAANGNRLRTRHDRDHWALTHEGRSGQWTTRVALQQEQASRTDWTNGVQAIASPDLTNTVLDAGLTTPLGNSVFKFGAQISRVDLEGISRQDAIPGSTYAANVDKVSLNNWALYAEDEYFLTDRLTLTGGVRMDHDERYGNEWTPRLHGVYKLSEATTLRGGVSKGFKAPTIRQSTAGYCMTSGGPVANFQPPGTLCGNPDLKPETSTNTEIGLHHDFAAGSSVSATLFHNDFKNKVTSYDTGVTDPRVPTRNIYVYDNLSQVTLKGIELSASTPLAKNWKLSGNYTYTKSKRGAGGEPAFNGSSLAGQPLDRTPEHVLNAQVDWKASHALALFARVNAMSEQYWAGFRNFANGTLRRPGSATFDIGGSYDFNRTLSLKFALLNVADRVMPVDTRSRAAGLAGNWLVDEGRRLAVSLNAGF